MEVQLYVYDLSQGIAKQMSLQFLGTQIDAVYHTSLVFDGVEYFFGAGVQTCRPPGTTHHGRPIEIIPLGNTELPFETILDYLESLKEVYTPESYDLFTHNCNNFTNDFAMFLFGRGIPGHITNLPAKVLETPFGQMLRPQLDASMRSITQAEVPAQHPHSSRQVSRNDPSGTTNPVTSANGSRSKMVGRYGRVVDLTAVGALDTHMAGAADTCTTIFFTSKTCAPCKMAYPMFDKLAERYPEALFIKIDINSARDIAMRYLIRATPTFMTFSKGSKVDEWTGADPKLLESNVELVIQQTFPSHQHLTLKVPSLQYGSMRPVTYAKVPPLDKLATKLGDAAKQKDIANLQDFIRKRSEHAQDAALPDLHSTAQTYKTDVLALPIEVRFAAVDLLRCAMVDPRVGGFFAEEYLPRTTTILVQAVNSIEECPHNLRLVTIHLACNIFSSPLYVKELLTSDDDSISALIQLVTSSLLDASHPTTRVAAASLAFNLAVANYRVRREQGEEALAEGEQVELAASLLETLSDEKNDDAAKALLLSFGYLVYCAPLDGELADLCKVLDARATLGRVKGHVNLVKEIQSLVQ
jgi:thiol-disulfide isomerase/thioredoxin